MGKKPVKRIVYARVSQKDFERLQRLKKEIGTSQAEVVRIALVIFGWLVEQLKKGNDVIVVNKQGEREKITSLFRWFLV